MDTQQVIDAAAAWTAAWLHGRDRPETVVQALWRLWVQATDPRAEAAVARAWRVVTGTLFGSVPLAA